MTITQLAKKIQEGEILPDTLVRSSLDKIKKLNLILNAVITITEKEAIEKAAMLKITTKSCEIAAIPMLIKDNISVKDIRMSASSKMLDNYIPPFDATIVSRLTDAICLGKTNLDAFAFGGSTENSGYGVTKNPWDITKVAGGSSGGSAAAVASDMCQYALGTDTGGSIREPAAFCGVVGLKPTYGRSSRYGIAAMGSSLDCPGPITQNVEDAAIILEYISGLDKYDGTSVSQSVPKFREFSNIKGMRVGLSKEIFNESALGGLEKGVKNSVLETVKILESLGAQIREVSTPYSVYALPVYYIITPSEITANMARFDGIRYGNTLDEAKNLMDIYLSSRSHFENEVKRRIIMGSYVLSSGFYDAYYNKASAVRTCIINELQETFKNVDILVGPTTPTTAINIGQNSNDPLAMYLMDLFTVTANIAGLPAISIPCGLSNGLPVGFQIMGKQFDEQSILNAAFAIEQSIQFQEKFKPSLG